MNPLALLDKLITEHGSAAVLRQHLALIRDQLQAKLKRMEELEAECRDLREENGRLTAELETQRRPEKWREYRGGLFKPTLGGGLEPDVYCPDCKIPMWGLTLDFPLGCSKCRRKLNFTGRQLPMVVEALKQTPLG